MNRTLHHPLAITMWDFSWLERRWPGAGYESWEQALDELCARGYDAVRIDAYPHLVAAGDRDRELLPAWNQNQWGSPALITVRVQENLVRFIGLCRERGLLVALSTWFRQDRDDLRMRIASPEQHAELWRTTLALLDGRGLLDSILYVDLCNEWSQSFWAPFLAPALGLSGEVRRTSPEATGWMRRSIEAVRAAYPRLDYCFSFCDELERWQGQDVSFMDLLEPHVWFTGFSDFYDRVPYRYEKFDPVGYENLVARGEALYRADPARWQAALERGIAAVAGWSRHAGKPLVTTECWGVVDYKDWPGLDWGWVKELCEQGVRSASATGRWAAVATSNFCGPQFVGMWRDVGWHRRLTDVIHAGALPAGR